LGGAGTITVVGDGHRAATMAAIGAVGIVSISGFTGAVGGQKQCRLD
jgi:hypothetical protein